jgi:hypothetical protein
VPSSAANGRAKTWAFSSAFRWVLPVAEAGISPQKLVLLLVCLAAKKGLWFSNIDVFLLKKFMAKTGWNW